MTIQVKSCTLSDVHTLQAISYETFDETFRATNVNENVDAYLEKAFTLEKLESELANTDSFFFFAYVNVELAGYLKVNINAARRRIKIQYRSCRRPLVYQGVFIVSMSIM